MKKWQCTVCGYIHNGAVPPEECPVCGADRTKFVEITDEQPESKSAIKDKAGSSSGSDMAPGGVFKFADQIARLHAHPISVHVPNGVLPVAVIFLIMGISFELPSLGLASFYNMVAVVVAMPFVLFFGYVDWRNRYKGKLTSLFITKIACGAFVAIAGTFLVIWRMVNPDVAGPASAHRPAFLLLHLLVLAAAVLAGYLGGKLVFKK